MHVRHFVVLKIGELFFLWATKQEPRFSLTSKKEYITVNIYTNNQQLRAKLREFYSKSPDIKDDCVGILTIQARTAQELEQKLLDTLSELTGAYSIMGTRIAEFGPLSCQAGWLIRNPEVLKNYQVQWK